MKDKRLGKKIYFSEFIITPVEQVEINGSHHRYGVTVFAECEPLGVIIESADKRWAIDINGRPISVDELIAPFPDFYTSRAGS